MNEIVIRDICGDYALDLPLDNASTFTLYFNSYQNALNVKRIIEVDRSVPNAASVCDMQEVVRCKDCRYWSALDKGNWVCEGRTDGECEMLAVKHNSESPCTEQDHFCSYGKRKDSADDDTKRQVGR